MVALWSRAIPGTWANPSAEKLCEGEPLAFPLQVPKLPWAWSGFHDIVNHCLSAPYKCGLCGFPKPRNCLVDNHLG
jgi:hypothetical protein